MWLPCEWEITHMKDLYYTISQACTMTVLLEWLTALLEHSNEGGVNFGVLGILNY